MRAARLLALLVTIGLLALPMTASPASATPDHFTPHAGPTFNSPIGNTQTRRTIFRKILRSVNSAPHGSRIHFFTWNFLTREGTDALLRAQSRGVTVRIIMDAKNNSDEVPNQPFRRLKNGLRKGNKGIDRKSNLSWARTCQGSCRGKTGSAHAKFFLFSQAGKAHNVAMQGSANLTLASTNNQWNDIYTTVRNKDVYNFWLARFQEAQQDKPLKRPFASARFGATRQIMFPLAGKTRKGKTPKDPVMQLLNQVTCRRATNTANHRTTLRIAPDVIRKERGMRLAQKVRQLWQNGCNIHIGYTVVGVAIGKLLRSQSGRGPVPMKHLVQDFNGDGEFDNYFHLKAMSIVGNVGGDRGNYVVLNGSANWSGLARSSDENLGIYWNKALTLRYQDHLDYWYDNFPKSEPSDTTSNGTTGGNGTTTARRGAVDAQDTGDELVFGSGKNAVLEDGTPYSTTGVNPYAHMDSD
ncbi:phospholipase D-like domain-containing protein [Nocardioides mangrovi]|nr:phospholipase D-like domain-containing protein [Nocardioides mangrovi]